MRFERLQAVCAVALVFLHSVSAAASDDHGDRLALTALGRATNSAKWDESKTWLASERSVCDWHGVKCTGGRVTSIHVNDMGLQGTLPEELEHLTELEDFKANSARPADYQGCGKNNFFNSSMAPFFGLQKLRSLNLEYTCLGGTLEGIEKMKGIQSLQVHGNYILGKIPESIGQLTNLQVLKLGRNPISGTVPAFTTLKNLIQFNCNFCALTGEFPDIFGHMPKLEISYWDGNGFTGNLPPSLALAKNLKRVSFNINDLSGPIPPGICNVPAGQKGGDCRIGADTELGPYQANYPWILPVKGNYYDCSAGVPPCAQPGGSCNTTKMYPSSAQNYSVIRCKDAIGDLLEFV